MSEELLRSYLRRFDRAKTRAQNWQDLFEAAYAYARPNYSTYETNTTGEFKNLHVFDTTLEHATNIFVSRVQNALTPPDLNWSNLAVNISSEDENIEQELSQQLEKINNIIFHYINTSNFELAINEAYYDLAIGTGFLQVKEGTDESPLIFESIPLKQAYPEEGPNGIIETIWRDFQEVAVKDIKAIWPDAKLPQVLDKKRQDDPTARIDLIEGMVFVPNEKNPENNTYEYVVIYTGSNDFIVRRENLPSSPWVAFRWGKAPGEVFGRGPVLSALPSAQTLNAMGRFEYDKAALSLYPPFMAFTGGILNPYNLIIEPNTIIPVDPVGRENEWPIKELETKPNVEFAQILAKDLREQINNLMLANPLPPIDSGVRTATELELRDKQFNEIAGPAFGRLQSEELRRIIKRCMFILKKKGLLPNIQISDASGNTITLDVEDKAIDVQFLSPITENQGQQDVKNFSEFIQSMQSIFGQELTMAMINVKEVPRWIGERLNANLELIKDSQELQQVMQRFMQAQQQSQQGQSESKQSQMPHAPAAAPDHVVQSATQNPQ